MDRTLSNRVDRPSGRKRVDTALIVAAAIVILFAVVGVVSAGSFVAGKVSGNATKATATVRPVSSNALASQDLHRAQAQATAIVKQAQSAGHSIVAAANARAHRQANSVIASARRQAASYRPPPVAAPAPAPTAAPFVNTSTGNSIAAPTSPGVAQVPAASSGASGSGSSVSAATGANSATSGNAAAVPDLRGVPSSWLVVGYNATFAGASGGEGTISVVNRSKKTFGGVAVVKYKAGGSSTASFSGLAPGQSALLRLSGAAYPGGGYQIVMSGVH